MSEQFSITALNVIYKILHYIFHVRIKATDSTVAKRGSVFIGLMTLNGAIWSRFQRTVLMR